MTAVEYALLIALLGMAIMLSVQFLGESVRGAFGNVTQGLNGLLPAEQNDGDAGGDQGNGDNNGWGDGEGGGQDHNG